MTTRLIPLIEVFVPALCLAASPSSLSELPRIERAFPLSSSAAEVNDDDDDDDDDDDERDCGCSACDILLFIVVEVNNAADVVNVTKNAEGDFLN